MYGWIVRALESGRPPADELSVAVHAASLGSSIAGQRFITTSRPASSARCAASSSITPSCIQTARAPAAIASSTCTPARSARRKMSIDLDPLARGYVGDARVAALPEHLVRVWVDRDDPEPAALQQVGDAMRIPPHVGGATDDRPRARLGQDLADRLGTGMNHQAPQYAVTALAGRSARTLRPISQFPPRNVVPV